MGSGDAPCSSAFVLRRFPALVVSGGAKGYLLEEPNVRGRPPEGDPSHDEKLLCELPERSGGQLLLPGLLVLSIKERLPLLLALSRSHLACAA